MAETTELTQLDTLIRDLDSVTSESDLAGYCPDSGGVLSTICLLSTLCDE
ncbi:hypothetical protein [Streptomyces iconiensis]|uniref:SapB/AmfS family lantipeptide n=1 Tax=Streptomyces iconiensis TaxID=1384038 RepID=A0ABT6ZW74_9ACTN|nr:hypothetical protein [Streptomyces iconiensis]MDJ1133322.1 hypothetical protein [Streptomyces iconiensis]